MFAAPTGRPFNGLCGAPRFYGVDCHAGVLLRLPHLQADASAATQRYDLASAIVLDTDPMAAGDATAFAIAFTNERFARGGVGARPAACAQLRGAGRSTCARSPPRGVASGSPCSTARRACVRFAALMVRPVAVPPCAVCCVPSQRAKPRGAQRVVSSPRLGSRCAASSRCVCVVSSTAPRAEARPGVRPELGQPAEHPGAARARARVLVTHARGADGVRVGAHAHAEARRGGRLARSAPHRGLVDRAQEPWCVRVRA